MTVKCDEIRSRLMTSDRAALSREAVAHLAGCDECAAFRRRLDLARESLRDHQADHLPDPHFAQRVSASVPGDADQLGWAAVRLLPVALALTLALTAWAWLATPGPSAMFEQSPTEDLLGWVLEEDGS